MNGKFNLIKTFYDCLNYGNANFSQMKYNSLGRTRSYKALFRFVFANLLKSEDLSQVKLFSCCFCGVKLSDSIFFLLVLSPKLSINFTLKVNLIKLFTWKILGSSAVDGKRSLKSSASSIRESILPSTALDPNIV